LNIRVIGYGRLAKTLVHIWKTQHHLVISSPTLKDSIESPNMQLTHDNSKMLENQDFIILAVKPNLIKTILQEMIPFISPKTVIVSVAAGITLDTIQTGIPKEYLIIRAMPNIAAEIGQSATLLLSNQSLAQEQCQRIESVFSELGLIDWVSTDDILDLGTILCGSGPAYVFYIMKAFKDSIVEMGMPKTIAEQMVKQTFVGASLLSQHKTESLLELQQQVTSPHGTTAAALEIFNQAQLPVQLHDALFAAWQRVVSLRQP
jgi:pyrroline-5-carboxylate reductase